MLELVVQRGCGISLEALKTWLDVVLDNLFYVTPLQQLVLTR